MADVYIEYSRLVADYLDFPTLNNFRRVESFANENGLVHSAHEHRILPDTVQDKLQRLIDGDITEWANLLRPLQHMPKDLKLLGRLHAFYNGLYNPGQKKAN